MWKALRARFSRMRWRRSVHKPSSLQWGNVWTNARSIASERRSGSRRHRSCGGAGGGGGEEASFGSFPSRSQPVQQPTNPGTDELTHLRTHVAQLEGDLWQRHRLATEKISAETSLKRRIDLLMQEIAALKARVPAPASRSGVTKLALVPVSRSGSALMSDLIEEAEKKRPRVHGEGAQ